MIEELIKLLGDRQTMLIKEYIKCVDEQSEIIDHTDEDNEKFGYYNGLCESMESEIAFLGMTLKKLGVNFDG
jgi:hypothetical protein